MGRSMYTSTIITHNPKYLDQFSTILLETFTTWLIFQDDQNKGQQPYVPIETTHYPKYLDKFLMILLETFTRGVRGNYPMFLP